MIILATILSSWEKTTDTFKQHIFYSREEKLEEHSGLITMKGRPLTLLGDIPAKGTRAPEFEVIDNDISTVTLGTYLGKTIILSSVASLDTPVCDMEVRRFNEEAGSLDSDIVILTVSMDLPFAQKRWCGAAGVERVFTLSDHRHGSFGKNYGVLIKELRLLARAVFILDSEGIIRYHQLVTEVSQEPDYEEVLSAVKSIT